jgi:nonribosomal peptide synthetase DhbF
MEQTLTLSPMAIAAWTTVFEEQARCAPDAVAIDTPAGAISYGALNARANRLAHVLLDQGVGPEAVVGLVLERSAEAIAAVLAVTKVGAAYCPFDIAHPPARLSFMAADAAPVCLVTSPTAATRVASPAAIVLVETSSHSAQARWPTSDPPPPALDARHPAYVIYTSGSTGNPKGVVVTHTGLADFTAEQRERYSVTA